MVDDYGDCEQWIDGDKAMESLTAFNAPAPTGS
jgi:hypothetical protein